MYFTLLVFRRNTWYQVQVASGITICQTKLHQAWEAASIYIYII